MLHANSFDLDSSSSSVSMNDVGRKYWIWNTEFRVPVGKKKNISF